MKSWKLQSGATIEFDGDRYYYLSRGRVLVNALDSFNTSFQLAVLREIGQPESGVR
jgi:hypothetical protein